jgi:branched-chain amino acid transport system permease protein
MAYLAYRIIRSRWGRSFVAIRDNVEAVGSCGINVSALKITAFTVCCIFICIGGAMYSHYATYLSPTTFSGLLSASFVVMLIIGGIGTVSGAFAGAVFVVLLPELLRFVGNYYMLVYVTIVMLSIMFLPGGIIPTLRRAKGNIKSSDVIKMFLDTGKKGDDRDE